MDGRNKWCNLYKKTQSLNNLSFQVLHKNMNKEEDKQKLTAAYNMLVDPQKMGERFKFMAFYPSAMGEILEKHPPVGFSNLDIRK